MRFFGKIKIFRRRFKTVRRIEFANENIGLDHLGDNTIGGIGLLAKGFIVSLVIFVAGLAIWGGIEYLMDNLLYSNPDFAIKRIDVRVEGDINPEVVKRWSGVHTGENIFKVDLAAIRRNLELVPQIKSAIVERVLPDTLRIFVVEREPIARVFLPMAELGSVQMNELWVDEDGYIFMCLDKPDSGKFGVSDSYPVIIGLGNNSIVLGSSLQSPEARAAVEIIKWYQRSVVAARDRIRVLDVSMPQVVMAHMESGAKVLFGVDRIPQQVRRLREVYELGDKLGRQLLWADLTVTNNLPVTWSVQNKAEVPIPGWGKS